MINIEKLRFGYRKRALLFEDLDLHLAPGTIYGLLGKNGAGKSSLLGIIQGLLFPLAGTVSILGYEARKRHPAMLADCFLISEELYLPNVSIHSFAGLYAPFYPNFDWQQLDRLLKEFELRDSASLQKISLGQKKKAMLAFGLATNARILLLDEPTNGLDIPSKKQFRSTLARHIREDRTFILSTHQIRDLQSLIDTLIVLENGRIIFQENLADIMERLHFSVGYQEPQDPTVIYYERVPGGYFTIRQAGQQESLEVDIELLFNAIISKPLSFQELFNTQLYVR